MSNPIADNPWFVIRQAQEALRTGRPEDAQRLLAESAAKGHRRVWELEQQVVRALVERAERQMRLADNPHSAWQDLLTAEALAEADPAVVRLRQALNRWGLAEVRAMLETGDPERALLSIAALRDRAVRQPELKPLEEAARAWLLARELADRGEFHLARQSTERIRRHLSPPFPSLEQFEIDLGKREQQFDSARQRVYSALDQRNWREVIAASDEILEVAPQCQEIRESRAKAWHALQPATVHLDAPAVEQVVALPQNVESNSRDHSMNLQKRFLLWIDGVGGYLVCLANRVTLGQATADVPVDIPLFADVSRLHAQLTRDGEGYVLEASRALQVNAKSTTRALLQPGDRLTLGSSCQFIFRRPVALSPSAMLNLVSGHRMPLSVDGVLLMSDTLILGPTANSHVEIPWLEKPVILYRHKDALGVKWPGDFRMDGQPCRDKAVIDRPTCFIGDSLSLAIESAKL